MYSHLGRLILLCFLVRNWSLLSILDKFLSHFLLGYFSGDALTSLLLIYETPYLSKSE